jgi:hypothetical protein
LVPFGFNEEKYKEILIKNLSLSISNFAVKNLWVICGSGVTFSCLAKVFPEVKFNLVVVGNEFTVPDDLKYRVLKEYKEKYLTTEVEIESPYPSHKYFDNKIWTHVFSHGQDGDFVLNAAPYI